MFDTRLTDRMLVPSVTHAVSENPLTQSFSPPSWPILVYSVSGAPHNPEMAAAAAGGGLINVPLCEAYRAAGHSVQFRMVDTNPS